MAILATCATLPLLLATARGGEAIALRGSCDRVVITRAYPRTLTILADGAKIRGVKVTGSNIVWRGGEITSPGGMFVKGPDNYAFLIRGASNIKVSGARFGLSRKALVIDRSENVTVDSNIFDHYGEDGIIVAKTKALIITHNRFLNVISKETACLTMSGSVIGGLSRRACIDRNGAWTDGFHADAIQMRDGVKDATIRFNLVSGNTQGITQMDTIGDAPLESILISNNEIWGSIHQVTLGGAGCIACRIENNKVRRYKGAKWRAVIRNGPASRCGNDVEDERRDEKCR